MIIEDGGQISTEDLGKAECTYCQKKVSIKYDAQGVRGKCFCGASFTFTPVTYEVFEQSGPKAFK
jgi:hypothetical protein